MKLLSEILPEIDGVPLETLLSNIADNHNLYGFLAPEPNFACLLEIGNLGKNLKILSITIFYIKPINLNFFFII